MIDLEILKKHFKPKQIEAIHLLAQGYTGIEIAAKLEVCRQTIGRWRKDPKFGGAVLVLTYCYLEPKLQELREKHGVQETIKISFEMYGIK